MDDVTTAEVQPMDEVQLLRQRISELEGTAAEHRRVAEALHMSESRFRSLVEQSPLSTQIFAPDGSIVQVNRAWEHLWGVSLDEIRDYNILDDPQLVAKGIMPYIQRGFAGEAVTIPPILYNPDDTLPDRTHHADPQRCVRAFIYPVNDQAGQLREVVLIHEDITERQHAEDALRESEARYRTLFDNFPNGSVFLFDRDLRYTVASGTGLEASGLSPDMFEGKTIWEIFPPEIATRDEPVLRAALRGEATHVEVSFANRTYLVHTLPVKDEADVIVGGMVMTQDITDRKRAEEHLQFLAEASMTLGASLDYDATLRSIARLAVPLLGELCAVFIVGPDGMSRPVASGHVNPVDEEQLRQLHAELVIEPAGEHPVARAIRTGQPVITPERLDGATPSEVQDVERRSPASNFVPPAHVVVPLLAREHVLGALVFGRGEPSRTYDAAELQLASELTHRAAQAIDRTRLYAQAQEALRTRDEFLSIAAHELKTPLTNVRGAAEVLQRRAVRTEPYMLTERDLRMLAMIAQQSQRLHHQIDTLLDFSHIGSDRPQLEFSPTDVGRLAERVVEEIQPALERHQVVARCQEPSLIVQGNAMRLEQVVQNLLQNAIKYSPDGGEITVDIKRRGSDVIIEVTDQGIGIPPEAQARLFERFYRARNAASLGISGMGIGLAVVTDIVAQHGGRVEVSSAEGEGSTFTISLPEYRDGIAPASTQTGA